MIDGDEISYIQERAKVIVKGHVKMQYKEVTLFCDEADYDANSYVAHVKGNVKIVRENAVVYGDNIVYDFKTQNAQMVNLHMESAPIYGQAKEANKVGQNQYNLKDGYVTTCNLKQPHYRLVAKRVTVYPGVKIVAKNMILKVGQVPVFYFPYFSQSLKDRSFPAQIIPGKNSDWGYYVLSRWRYRLNEEQRGKIHFDWYEKRGLAQGITHKAETKNFGEALFNYYFIQDELYKLEKRKKLFDKFPERETIAPKYLEDDRYKAQMSYSWQATDALSIKSEFHKFSDENFMKDFFYREYQIEPHPLSYTLIDYSFEHSSLSLLTQKRVNRFFSETEYLPQLEYNLYRQQLGATNFYLDSKTTVGKLTSRAARSHLDYDTFRLHSYDTLSYPSNIKWLYLNPHLGFYGTHYTKDIFKNANISRFASEVGADLNTKLYRTFNVNLNKFGIAIEKMRHIITPTVSYLYIRPPTVSKAHLFQFDSLDDLERKEAIVFKLDNKLQAKYKDEVWDFLYFSPAVEYRVHQKGKGSFFNSVDTTLEIYPKTGVSFNAKSKYDAVDRALREANIDLSLSDSQNKKYALSVGHRYARDEDSQGTLNSEFQITPKVRFKNYLRYEYNTGKFRQQQYVLKTDLHCWWLDLGLDIGRDRNLTNYTFWFAFTLKDFPDIHIGFDQTYRGAKKDY